MSLLNKKGLNIKTNQPIEYEFCIPDNETTLAQVLAINPLFKKTVSKGMSKCGSKDLLILGTTDNKAYKNILCKITNLGFVKEINQTFWE